MADADFHRRVVELAEPEPESSRSLWGEAMLALEILQTFAFTTTAMLLAWAVLPGLLPGWQSAAIVSGSMAPAVEVGDIVVFRPAGFDDLAPDAVIRFRSADAPEGESPGTRTVTHRVVEVDPEGRITTRGDANGSVDGTPVTIEEVEGLGVLVVPLVGFPLVWAQQGRTFPLLQVAVALVVMSLPGVLRKRDRSDSGTGRGPRALGPLVGGRLPILADTGR